MTDYTWYAGAVLFGHVKRGELVAKAGSVTADALRRMTPGEFVVPLYETAPVHGDEEQRALSSLCEAAGLDLRELLEEYASVAGTVPHCLRILDTTCVGADPTEACVAVEVVALPQPLPASDYLRLRELPDTVAAQFKGSAPQRPVQEIGRAAVAALQAAAAPDRDEASLLRRFSIVAAQTPEAATAALVAAGREPLEGDAAYLVTHALIPGRVTADVNGTLGQPLERIGRSPEACRDLLIDAQRKATPSDPFNADAGIAAVDELIGLLNSGEQVKPIDDFPKFYEFRSLSRAVTQAMELAKRPLPADTPRAQATEAHPDGLDAAAALQGLSVEAVLAELPDGFSVERGVVAAAVAALRAGKHLLLGGPPGSGKTTLAEALCRAVVGTNYDVTTATADWTTFDTIGGYLPDAQGLRFVPGVVLRALRSSGWLIIDEVNRADIDKAFGPLFTVLSGGEGSGGRTSTLPYTTGDGKPVMIEWAANRATSDGTYVVTPSWRILGTLNVADKASLFRLSFAFLRRFAVVDVPLPSKENYRELFARWFSPLDAQEAALLAGAAIAIATGPVQIGPAIGRDLATVIVEGLAETASGQPTFADSREALLTATRLLIVPQYEGQALAAGDRLLGIVDDELGASDSPARASLAAALREVALT